VRSRRVYALVSLVGAGLIATLFYSPKSEPAIPEPKALQAPASRVEVLVGGHDGAPMSPVWIDAREVTVSAYKDCVMAGACTAEHITSPAERPCNYDAPDRGDHPMNCVDWLGAEQYCQWSGGRLCRDTEWFSACRGPSNTDYPYGSSYQAGACNSATRGNVPVEQMGTTPAASLSSCEGGYPGLYDIVGNVSEWVDACKGDYCKFYGGGYLNNDPIEDFASCKQFCAGNQRTFKSATIGFRCCHDSDGDTP
jgi:formylglycine-generating enzyme required for sulfatase activity